MDNIYKTSDLYLSAFLKLKGHKFTIEKNQNKISFIFDKTDVLTTNIVDYLSEGGNCEPLLFVNSIKNLKNLIYNS
jgi:hypothetical protein